MAQLYSKKGLRIKFGFVLRFSLKILSAFYKYFVTPTYRNNIEKTLKCLLLLLIQVLL